MTPFGSSELFVVEPGTEIEWLGEKLTVNEGACILRGRQMFMTQATFEKVKAAIPSGKAR